MASPFPPGNYWLDSKCAKAFRHQHELASYQELLAATVASLEPRPEERWLDLGCGRGHLSKALWQASAGRCRLRETAGRAEAGAHSGAAPVPGRRLLCRAGRLARGQF